ncbi:uncharacterized protein LOC107025113 [Solanum pennellii]|uniref:Uncharacterized protein LOC107025113 n=1 Tax=Solanum pennellii TaxID=28526 RepID=A0ABM1H7E6_SOLPN|nr:uncharacterized protein LOC107025113 [Solanum pennellii]
MFSQVVTNQTGKQRGARQKEVEFSRIREFLRMNPPSFSGLNTTEDPKNFIEELKNVFEVEKKNLRDREDFKNKRPKTGNGSRQKKSNANQSSFKQKRKGPALSSASAPAKNKGEYYGQNSRVKFAYSQGNVAQGGSKPPTCAKCSRNHSGVCREGSNGCFNRGQTRNFMQECPRNKQGNGNGGNRASLH